MIVEFEVYKYQDIYDYIKSFDNKLKSVRIDKNKIYENGFKTAIYNSELYKFFELYKAKNGLKDNNIYYPTHSQKPFNKVYNLMKRHNKNSAIVQMLMKLYNSMIYELYFYEQAIKNDKNLIKCVENDRLFSSRMSAVEVNNMFSNSDTCVNKNLYFINDQIKSIKEYIN